MSQIRAAQMHRRQHEAAPSGSTSARGKEAPPAPAPAPHRVCPALADGGGDVGGEERAGLVEERFAPVARGGPTSLGLFNTLYILELIISVYNGNQ